MSEMSFDPASSSSSAAPNVLVAPADVLVDASADASVSAPVDTQIPASVATAAIAPNPNSSAPCRCEVCGVGGIVSNFYSPRFCSRECRYERNKGNHVLPRPDIGIITCRECGKVGSSTEFFSAKYCSKKCRYERGGRPAPHSQSSDAGVTGDSSSNLDPRHKAKRDLAALNHSAALPSDSISFAARAVTLPVVASAARGVHVSTYHHPLHNSAAANTIDSTSNQVAATVAANWQLLVDYQPRDREQAASVPYLVDAIAALQETIVHSSLECARAETLLEATNRRQQELDNDINSCTIGASDAASVEDRKLYHDIIRKMWVERALLQKDEIRMLEQLRKQLESKGKLRTQLLDKQQTLLTLGLTVFAFLLHIMSPKFACSQCCACSCRGALAGVL